MDTFSWGIDSIIEMLKNGEEISRIIEQADAIQHHINKIYSATPIGLVYLQIQGDKENIIQPNKAFLDMFDFSIEDVIGRDINYLIVPEEMRQESTELRTLDTLLSYEAVRHTSSGEMKHVLINGKKFDYRGDPRFLVSYQDITKEVAQREELKKTHDFIENIFMSSPEGLAVLDSSGNIIRCNPTYCSIAGVTEEEALEFNVMEHATDERLKDAFGVALGGKYAEFEDWYTLSSGKKSIYINIKFNPTECYLGSVIVSISNNTEKQLLIEELQRTSITDQLTGVYNRNYMMRQMPASIAAAERYGRPLSVVAVDIDHFKSINDSYGHLYGDQVLKGFAKIMSDGIRKEDYVFRYGGEEFIIVLPETDSEQAFNTAERLRRDLSETDFKKGQVTASFGVFTYVPKDLEKDMSIEKLIGGADRNLYQAKKSGRNKVVG